nr:MAG TPA: hypothetical protein [Caudoviricetes sp.]
MQSLYLIIRALHSFICDNYGQIRTFVFGCVVQKS